MSSRKKKRSCPFSSAKERPKKAKNTFDKKWAAKLAESDKGSYYNQEKLLDELDRDQHNFPLGSGRVPGVGCSGVRALNIRVRRCVDPQACRGTVCSNF